MAVANFFEKAAMGASQILNGVDAETLSARLEDTIITVAFDASAVASSEGRLTLELCVNMLARFYPVLHLLPLDDDSKKDGSRLKELATAINPEIEFANNPETITISLVVGNSQIPDNAEAPTIYLGSDKWIARISQAAPVGSIDSNNPFGAGAAACVGVANVFRYVFRDTLEKAELDEELSLSMFDFEVNTSEPTNPDIRGIDLGDIHLVGVGAIGNAAAWVLARTGADVSGHLHLIDHEQIDLTNLQRYALAVQGDVDKFKVERAAEEFASSRITPDPHKQTWGEYQREHQEWRLQHVVVGVDNAEDRRAVQASLPRHVTNSWTQAGDVGISRHYSFGVDPCVVCLYFPEVGAANLDQLVTAAIGMPEANMEIRLLLHNNAPIGRPMLERIASAMSAPLDPLLRFADHPLHTFYTQAICSGMVMKLGGKIGGNVRAAEVPMAFQSTMAGIMLASELIAEAGKLRKEPLTTTSRIDMLHPIHGYINRPEIKEPSGRCICYDPDYLSAYHSRYRAT